MHPIPRACRGARSLQLIAASWRSNTGACSDRHWCSADAWCRAATSSSPAARASIASGRSTGP